MRKYIGGNDDRLEKWADEIASRTCMREYRDGNSHDWNRTSTKAERAVLRAVAFGALLSLNWGDDAVEWRYGAARFIPVTGCDERNKAIVRDSLR